MAEQVGNKIPKLFKEEIGNLDGFVFIEKIVLNGVNPPTQRIPSPGGFTPEFY